MPAGTSPAVKSLLSGKVTLASSPMQIGDDAFAF
jgi:hypothetical protein